MLVKKYKKARLTPYSKLFFQLGLLLSLVLIYIALEWKTVDRVVGEFDQALFQTEEIMDIPITERILEVKPPPPPPPAPDVIEIVADQEEIIETVLESTETDELEVIEIQELDEIVETKIAPKLDKIRERIERRGFGIEEQEGLEGQEPLRPKEGGEGPRKAPPQTGEAQRGVRTP